jgi:surface polysaccharide O-acyltransferase-like enzyme
VGGISNWTSTAKLNWDIGQSFEYLGYFMTGYSIRMMCKKKSNRKAFIMIISGVLLEVCVAGLKYKQMVDGIVELKHEIVSPYSLLIVPASVFIFCGFTLLSIDRNFIKCSSLTLYIYLIHAGVWDFMVKIFYRIKGDDYLTDLDGGIWIMIFTIIVFIISYCLSKLYVWLWDKINKERRITKVMVQIAHLQME